MFRYSLALLNHLGWERRAKSLEDTTTVYTVQNGQPQATVVKDPKQLATIREKLCANVKKSKLCPARIP
jgi:hypothetical protein